MFVILITSTMTSYVFRNEANTLRLSSRGQSQRGSPCHKLIALLYYSTWVKQNRHRSFHFLNCSFSDLMLHH